ncbi:GNAT family N-acetyltransferase [Legionella shakespearei]|uniref:GNAT family acetyltransferase n=1 Tax=Legionella shakespearei DSM 23087 TaxID=1122169 RepID=A0A0W0ZA68_9GAMM|nr:GNAT family N-acetyltransferase [Legionella shakespearei]KTD65951.1 GNAT family acetyltransferase [Legionella shakespearei DSM 23087]
MRKYLINTTHLGMRFIRKGDAHHIEDVEKDPEVKRFYPEGELSDQEIQDFIDESIKNQKEHNLPCFLIFKARNDAFVGEAYFDRMPTGEIKVGYMLDKKYWNKGYATEVLKALLNWAKLHIDAEYIVAYADRENEGSFRVMEKCGMKYYKSGTYKNMESFFYRIKNR